MIADLFIRQWAHGVNVHGPRQSPVAWIGGAWIEEQGDELAEVAVEVVVAVAVVPLFDEVDNGRHAARL